MRPMSLLDNQSDQPEDQIMVTHNETHDAALHDLALTVKVIQSNYVTKEDLAATNGKLDVLANNLEAFQTHAQQALATKAELSNAVYQLTWRMAGFTAVLISATVASVRYL